MANPDQALATQLKNIEAKTGKSRDALYAMVAGCGFDKVGEQRKWLMEAAGLTYGDANTIVLLAAKQGAKQAAAPQAATAGDADPLDAIYSGNKAHLRALHDTLMKRIVALGSFEVAPKKTYVSLRRKKQFAMVGPATAKAIEVGLNSKTLPPNPRLKVMPPASMCQATTRIETDADIDDGLLNWLKQSFDEAG